jgi:hypothetical protein
VTSLDSFPEAVPGGAGTAAKQIPPAAVARLTIYLRALTTLLADGVDRVSSESLAEASGVFLNAAQGPLLRRLLRNPGCRLRGPVP